MVPKSVQLRYPRGRLAQVKRRDAVMPVRLNAWVPAVLIAIVSLGFYLPTAAEERVANDSHASSASAWRIATTGSPWMEGVDTSKLEGSAFHDTWLVDGANDHTVYNRTPGSILPAVPLYRLLNADPAPEGFEIWVGGLAASLMTSMAGVLLFCSVRRYVGTGVAFFGSLAFLLATPAWSVSADALWTHNLTLAGIAAAMYSATRERWWLAGFSFALAIFARPHVALVAAVVGLYLAWRLRRWQLLPIIGASSATGLVALVVWNRLVFGAWSLSGGYGTYVTDNLVAPLGSGLMHFVANAVGFFFAPDRGLFVWTPVLLLLLPSLLANWRKVPYWMRAFVFGGLLYSTVQLRINDFFGGQGFYGYRLPLELLVCVTPAALAAFLVTARWTRVAIGSLLGLQFAAIAIGAARDYWWLGMEETWTSNVFVATVLDDPVLGVFALAMALLAGAAMLWVTEGRLGSASSGSSPSGPTARVDA